MGNYLFNPRVLVELLEEANRHGATDFGHHIMPLLPRRHAHGPTTLRATRYPGVHPYEERGYWRDIGTIEAYRAAQRDVLGPLPRFDLANPEWPIRRGAYGLPETAHHATSAANPAGFAEAWQLDTFGTPARIAHAVNASARRAGRRIAHAEKRGA